MFQEVLYFFCILSVFFVNYILTLPRYYFIVLIYLIKSKIYKMLLFDINFLASYILYLFFYWIQYQTTPTTYQTDAMFNPSSYLWILYYYSIPLSICTCYMRRLMLEYNYKNIILIS